MCIFPASIYVSAFMYMSNAVVSKNLYKKLSHGCTFLILCENSQYFQAFLVIWHFVSLFCDVFHLLLFALI